MEKESSHRVEVSVKLEDEVKELKNLVKELKADAIEKDTCLDHLQKRSDELCTLLGETKAATIREFKASSEFTDFLDRNYAAGFGDFCMDALNTSLEWTSDLSSFASLLRAHFSRRVPRI